MKKIAKILLVLVVLSICLLMPACGGSDTESISDPALATDETAEQNSSARVDEIIAQAKQDADKLNNDGASKATTYIVDHYPNFYDSNEVMEKTIYYGALLENWELDTQGYNKFGQDVVQAVKYVYRGIESKDDEATKKNLAQIEEDAQEVVNNR